MMLKAAFFLLSLLCAVILQAAELGQISAEELLGMQNNDHALVLDIRTEAEWKSTGVIPGSRTLQSYNGDGSFDSNQWLTELQKLKTSPDQPIILVCRSGNRSSKLGGLLVRQGMNHVYHLTNGIQSWIQSGHPVHNYEQVDSDLSNHNFSNSGAGSSPPRTQ